MKILICAWALDNHSGIPLFTRDHARSLQEAGAEVAVYTLRPGVIAEEIAACGVAVVTRLNRLPFQPDVIHGQDQPLFVRALRRFPHAAAISLTHDATSKIDAPFLHPRVDRYVAVDERCRKRIEAVGGIAAERIHVLPNAVDLGRFVPRSPLPPLPRRALIFSNYAHAASHMPPVMQACAAAGLAVDVVGSGVGKVVTRPETILPDYDIVFAKARCALEALATGNAVVLCDFTGLGPMVTSGNVMALRRMNFGAGVLTQVLSAGNLAHAIAGYAPADAAMASQMIRQAAGLHAAAAAWMALYRDAIRDRANRTPMPDDAALAAKEHAWRNFYRIVPLASGMTHMKNVPVVGAALYSMAARLWHARF